jgi:hypothetical protein
VAAQRAIRGAVYREAPDDERQRNRPRRPPQAEVRKHPPALRARSPVPRLSSLHLAGRQSVLVTCYGAVLLTSTIYRDTSQCRRDPWSLERCARYEHRRRCWRTRGGCCSYSPCRAAADAKPDCSLVWSGVHPWRRALIFMAISGGAVLFWRRSAAPQRTVYRRRHPVRAAHPGSAPGPLRHAPKPRHVSLGIQSQMAPPRSSHYRPMG